MSHVQYCIQDSSIRKQAHPYWNNRNSVAASNQNNVYTIYFQIFADSSCYTLTHHGQHISGLNPTDNIRPVHRCTCHAGVGQIGGCVRRHGCISVSRRGGSRSMPRNRGTPESRAHQQASACSAVPIHLEHRALGFSSIMRAVFQGIFNPFALPEYPQSENKMTKRIFASAIQHIDEIYMMNVFFSPYDTWTYIL